jgi:hypothetical protein
MKSRIFPLSLSRNIFLLLFLAAVSQAEAQDKQGHLAPKPLFRDPVFDGAADPVVIWNDIEKKWFMFYTNRRANADSLDGVKWVHGTRIGIAESADGAAWTYRDTADIQYRPDRDYTHWAPEVIRHEGKYHMFLTYVPGVFGDWNHPRQIVHLTSSNLLQWKYESTLKLASDRVIDACVFRMPNGNWRMYYNNERDRKSIYYADSDDLFVWKDGTKVIADRAGEGPKVFEWKGNYWMVVDNWKGLSVYKSADFNNWSRQEESLLALPGVGVDDQVIGGHPDVVVGNDRAFLFYFTHPGRIVGAAGDGYEKRRSSLQVTELNYVNNSITCDRNTPTYVSLQPPGRSSKKKGR